MDIRDRKHRLCGLLVGLVGLTLAAGCKRESQPFSEIRIVWRPRQRQLVSNAGGVRVATSGD